MYSTYRKSGSRYTCLTQNFLYFSIVIIKSPDDDGNMSFCNHNKVHERRGENKEIIVLDAKSDSLFDGNDVQEWSDIITEMYTSTFTADVSIPNFQFSFLL